MKSHHWFRQRFLSRGVRRKDILFICCKLIFALPTFNTLVLKEKLAVLSAISSQSTKHCLSIILFVISFFYFIMKCMLAAIIDFNPWSFDHFYFNIFTLKISIFFVYNLLSNFVKRSGFPTCFQGSGM